MAIDVSRRITTQRTPLVAFAHREGALLSMVPGVHELARGVTLEQPQVRQILVMQQLMAAQNVAEFAQTTQNVEIGEVARSMVAKVVEAAPADVAQVLASIGDPHFAALVERELQLVSQDIARVLAQRQH